MQIPKLKLAILLVTILVNSQFMKAFPQEVEVEEFEMENHNLKLPKLIPYRENRYAWGFADSTGTIRIKPIFNMVQPFEYGLAKITTDAGSGLIDEEGNVIIKPIYQDVHVFKNGLIRALGKNKKWGFINRKGEEIVPVQFDMVNFLAMPDLTEKIIITTIKQLPGPTQPGNPLERSQRYFGLYSLSGNQILAPEFTEINYKKEGIIEACKGKECQVINLEGKDILPLNQFRISNFNEGIAILCSPLDCRYVNKKGGAIFPQKFASARPFLEGMAAVKTNHEKWGYFNRKGKLVIPAVYTKAEDFKNGLALITEGDRTGVINLKERLVYGYVKTNLQLKPANLPGKFWLLHNHQPILMEMDKKTGMLIPAPAATFFVGNFENGLAPANQFGQFGFVDENQKVIIPFEYERITPFKHNLAVVKKDDYWGVIDKNNKVILPFEFASILVVSPDLFRVELKRDYENQALVGILNREGQEVAPVKYLHIGNFKNGLAPFQINDTYGMLNLKGEEVVPPVPIPLDYMGCGGLKDGLIRVCHTLSNERGFVDRYGRVYFKY